MKGIMVDVRIGIINNQRELTFETNEDQKAIEEHVAKALAESTNFITFADSKGKTYIVPTANLGYVELGQESTRRIGFVA